MYIPANPERNKLLKKYQGVFHGGLGTLKELKAKLIVPDECTPKFFKATHVPYALGPKVDAELDRLEPSAVFSKVKYSEWAAPIVPVVKTEVTLNPVLQDVMYPLPKTEGVFTRLGGGQHFTKIDLIQAYLQMEVEEESKKYLTVNTQTGFYRYNRHQNCTCYLATYN